jgi:hypothetical protein
MWAFTLVCSVLLGVGVGDGDGRPAGPTAEDRRAYEEKAAEAGRDADAQVRLALWCEGHGMPAERLNHLGLAVLADPAHAVARGLLGQVRDRDRWRRPEEVADEIKADAKLAGALAEYEARRAATPGTADAQWKLALWCEQHGLKAEAVAHFTAVARLDPTRVAAWKHLGCVVFEGRWVTPRQRAAEHAEEQAQRRADLHYRVVLEHYRRELASKNAGLRAAAEAALDALTDPRAVPMVWKVFAQGNPDEQALAVQVLGRIKGPDASRGLAFLAAAAGTAEVRAAATKALKKRDAREYVGILVALVKKPIKYQVRPVGGPGSPGVLYVEGEEFNRRRFYAPPPLPSLPNLPIDGIGVDAFGLPVVSMRVGMQQASMSSTAPVAPGGGVTPAGPVRPFTGRAAGAVTSTVTATQPINAQVPIGEMVVEAQRAALVAWQQEADDVALLDAFNRLVRDDNDRVLDALKATTGKEFGDKPEDWNAWWTDQQGYAYEPPKETPKPTIDENVPLAYQPQPVPIGLAAGPVSMASSTFGPHHSCFAGGTLVRTRDGRRAIEDVRVGDVLLTEDTRTGRLDYQPVLAVFHNKPAPTLKIDLGGDAVTATPIHRFWVAGKGWTMARELKAGDLLRIVGGVAKVVEVTPETVQPVFNLEVDSGHDFFVGKLGVLAHDNSLVRPVERPFDDPGAK